MGAWSKVELHKISEADDLHISPLREDGVTCGFFSSPDSNRSIDLQMSFNF